MEHRLIFQTLGCRMKTVVKKMNEKTIITGEDDDHIDSRNSTSQTLKN